MMLCMAFAMCSRRISRIIFCFILLTWTSLQTTSAGPFDSQGAARAYEEARQKQNEIAQALQPAPSQYLECAKTFRKVYLKDPHFRRSAEAIYQEARIYQEMGDKFAALDYYRTAVKRFDLLVTADNSIAHQQNLKSRRIALVVLSRNRWRSVQRVVKKIVAAVDAAEPGSYTLIEVPTK